MKKLVLAILMMVALVGSSGAQERTIHRNIGLDSLVSIMRETSGKKVYCASGSFADNYNFTVDGASSTLEEDIKGLLKDMGFAISVYDDAYFILKGVGLNTALPYDYFLRQEKSGEKEQAKDYVDALLNLANVATIENKVYQIGESNNVKKTGKVYLSGYVRDSRTGEPVIGAGLYDNVSKVFAQTDMHGFYKMALPVGKSEIEVTGYSLEDSKVHLQVYNDGTLDIVVKEKVFALTGVVVSAENTNKVRTNEMGIERVRMSSIKNVPTVFGETDVVKIILTLPGVKSVGEASSGFNVRGGATDQNLVLFNGGSVYNPSHLFGMFSGFNPDIVSDIELYKCSIPVEYGGRISSVLDVNSREGNNKNVTGSLSAGLLTARGHIEGPLSSNTTFIAGGRATYSDWLLGFLPDNSEYHNGTASFYDMTAGVSHKINENNSIHLNGYYSKDAFKFSIDTSYRYENLNASVKWRRNMRDKHSMEAVLGYDQYGYSTIDKHNPATSYDMSFKIMQGRGKVKFKTVLDDAHTLVYGAEALYYNLMPGRYAPYGEESVVAFNQLDTENAVEGALYLSDTWNVSDKFSWDYGVRFSMFNSDKFYAGPEIRVSGRYMISPQFSVKGGFNSMRQYVHMLSNSVAMSPTDTWKLSDKDIKPQKGWQAAAGLYASLFQNRVEASLEGYYKSMNDYLDYKSGATIIMNPNIADDVVATKGQAYGVELMLKKPMGKLNGWISYTYSRARLRESGDRGVNTINGGQWYSASFDKPHDLKLVGNYKFTHRLSISVNADYTTGRPVTVPVATYYYAGAYRLYYTDRNSYRIKDYFRLDAALNIEPTHRIKAFTHMSFTIGVYNVTGRKNVYSVYFENEGNSGVKGYMLSIFGAQIPYVNFNFKF